MEEPSVSIAQPMYSFKALSLLKNEAKGSYILGTIKIPNHCPDIKIALYSKNKTPHPHLLFITPSSRVDSKRPKIMQKESYCVNLKYKNESYELDTTNHPYLPDSGILGDKFWNEETKEIQLGPEGLRLTVAKALQKGTNSTSLSVSAMKDFRGNSEKYLA